MNTYIFLLPLYNDWESFSILSKDINLQMKNMNKTAEILIVNDFSTQNPPVFKPLSNIKYINILNLKKNLGSQKAISIGLKYLKEKNKSMIITILDSDGEDDVSKISLMISQAEKRTETVIVSSRTKRQEIFMFKILYSIHKLLTFIFTFKWMSFGNFCSFHSSQLDKILSNDSSWLAFSSSIAKNCIIEKMEAERKKRIIGTSKISFLRLVFHSLRVNSVFFFRSFLLSLLYIFVLYLLYLKGYQWSLYLVSFIIFYNVALFLTIFFNVQKKFFSSLDYLKKN